ncbi:MAG: biotin/lipoyl-binding protein [Deltaproteobacteria bacterium]
MTRKQDEQKAPSGAERATRRGLGIHPDPRGISDTGEFPLDWPELPESPELPPSEPRTEYIPPRDTDEVTSSWQRPQSRGPEYHPPALPAAARMPPPRVTSGTFRVGTPPLAQLHPTPVEPFPLDPAFPLGGGPQADAREGDAPRPSSPSLPPVERSAGRGSALPRLARLGGRLSGWPLLAGLVVGSTLALSLVRVPVRAWGVLKTTGAPESLGAPLSGSVVKLRVAAGDSVEPGEVIVEIRSPELESSLSARRSELERLRQETDSAARAERAALARNLLTLANRRELLEQRLALKETEFAQRKALLEGLTAPIQADFTREGELLEATAALQAASEERLGIVDALSQLELEVSDRRGAQLAQDGARSARLAEAEAGVLQAQAALDATAVRAPAAGWVESFRISSGSSVQPGAELARFVPRSLPRTVSALLAEEGARDAQVGADASVELVSPLRTEGSVLPARIRYISREVAPAGRVQALLGEAAPGGFVQLEVDLLDSVEYQALQPELRIGSRVLVILPTPQRRLGSVLFNAVRQWWEFGVWA